MQKNLIRRAIDLETLNLIPAQFAIKGNKYKCPQCNEIAIFCKGKIVRPYFRHNSESNCSHFESTGESADHLECKLIISNLINKNKKIEIIQECNCCTYIETFEINLKSNNSKAICEEKINDKARPDITVRNLKSNKIKLIIEIKNTHATRECDRKDYKWVELDARNTLDNIRLIESKEKDLFFKEILKLKSIRKFRCVDCKNKRICKLCNKEDKIYGKKYCINCELTALKKIYKHLKPKIKNAKNIVLQKKIEKAKKIATYWEQKNRQIKENEEKMRQKIEKLKQDEYENFKKNNGCYRCTRIDSMSIKRGYCYCCFAEAMKIFNKLDCIKKYKIKLQIKINEKNELLKLEKEKLDKKIKENEIKKREDFEKNIYKAEEIRNKYIKEYGNKCRCKIKFKKMCFCEIKNVSCNAEHCSNCMKKLCKC